MLSYDVHKVMARLDLGELVDGFRDQFCLWFITNVNEVYSLECWSQVQ